MIALDTRRLAGVPPLYYETLHSPSSKVHRQTQADGTATDDEHFRLTGFTHARIYLVLKFTTASRRAGVTMIAQRNRLQKTRMADNPPLPDTTRSHNCLGGAFGIEFPC